MPRTSRSHRLLAPAPRPLHAAIALTLTLALGLLCPSFAHAEQPTFGRPKPKNPPPERVDQPLGPDGPRPARIPPEQDWRDDDPPRLQPEPTADPGKVFLWKTDDGTRYAWSLPFDFDPNEPYDLVVLLHPARMDFRWGFSAHRREKTGFRPNDVVVSIDGMGGDLRRPNQRFFTVSKEAAIRFRDIMLELSRVFGPRHLYLYGSGAAPESGAGGTFALAFAAEFPALADGVLVHAASPAPDTVAASSTPIVFLQGAKDSFHPLRHSLDALAAYREEGHQSVRLRVLREYNDFPNPVRADECLHYLQAMAATEPADVLAHVERMLAPKLLDEFNYAAPVWYSSAYAALGRLLGSAANPLNDVPEALAARAAQLQDAIDAEAQAHVDALRPLLQTDTGAGLALDGGPWLGYLLAFRDDFAGVPSAEALAATLGLDALITEHAARARDIIDAFDQGDAIAESELFARIVETLPHCYLFEALPIELVGWTRAAMRKADELGLAERHTRDYEYVQLWERGWRDGLSAYERRWRLWSGPPAAKATPETP